MALSIFKNSGEVYTETSVNNKMKFGYARTVNIHSELMSSGKKYLAFASIFIYLAGDIDYIIEGNALHPEPYDIITVRPGESFVKNWRRSQPYERFLMFFDLDIFDEILPPISEFRDEIFGFLLNRTFGERNIIRPSKEERNELIMLLKEGYALVRLYTPESRFRLLGLYIRMILFFNKCYSRKNTEEGKSFISPRTAEILKYINLNYRSIHNISEIADAMHISNEYMSRFFKHDIGMTLKDYLCDKRLSESKRLLLSGANVTEACFSSGFNNTSHFIQVFRAHVGITPSEYKRESIKLKNMNSFVSEPER